MKEGDLIKLNPKTGKGKQVVHRDGCIFEVLGFSINVHFSEETDWVNLQSVDNPKNGRWMLRKNDKNFEWEAHI